MLPCPPTLLSLLGHPAAPHSKPSLGSPGDPGLSVSGPLLRARPWGRAVPPSGAQGAPTPLGTARNGLPLGLLEPCEQDESKNAGPPVSRGGAGSPVSFSPGSHMPGTADTGSQEQRAELSGPGPVGPLREGSPGRGWCLHHVSEGIQGKSTGQGRQNELSVPQMRT